MRILVTTTPGERNLGPVRVFAEGFQRSGHDVLMVVEGSGVEQMAEATVAIRPLETSARLDLRGAYDEVLAAILQWRPDLVVHETAEYSAVPAAETAGVPVARIAVVSGSQERAAAAAAAPALDALREEVGLTRDPEGTRILSGRGMTLIPRVLEDTRFTGTLERYRAPQPWPKRLPDWWGGDQRPLVHVTLGKRPMEVYRDALQQMAAQPVRVLVTVGHGQDATELGALPIGAHLNPGWTHADLMPYTSIVVCDGASGVISAALTAGVPMVAIPLGSGQNRNANAVEAAGAGLALESVAAIGTGVATMLRSTDYKTAAETIAAELAALPPVDEAMSASLTSA